MRSPIRTNLTALLVMGIMAAPTYASPKKAKKHRMLSPAERAEQGLPDPLPVKLVAKRHTHIDFVEIAQRTAKLNTRYREGIDVSRYQGVIDWQRVAAEGEVSYAYVKATEGAQLVDRTYAYNLSEARKAGISVGSYHFYRPNISVDAQVENMTANVRKNEQDLVPLIDIETRGNVSGERFIADLTNFIERIEDHYGRKPLLYTYQNFYNKYLVGQFKGYLWMIAKYQEEEPVLRDNIDYIMWQYTQTGRIPGIRGNVDRSCLMGNYTLRLLQM